MDLVFRGVDISATIVRRLPRPHSCRQWEMYKKVTHAQNCCFTCLKLLPPFLTFLLPSPSSLLTIRSLIHCFGTEINNGLCFTTVSEDDPGKMKIKSWIYEFHIFKLRGEEINAENEKIITVKGAVSQNLSKFKWWEQSSNWVKSENNCSKY